MSHPNESWGKDFEALSRQYWNAWSEMARQAGSGHDAAIPGWKEAIDLWSPWAKDGRAQTDETVSRMNQLTGEWFGKMQELAKTLAGKPVNPAEIASEWKRALGIENNPFVGMFQNMSGPDAHGLEHFFQQSGPWLDTLRGNWSGMFNLPAFGLAREHQERWQALGRAQLEYQQAMNGYNAQLMECGQRAFARFEDKLAERSEPGRQVDSARALFDLWIDAAEEAWGEVAMTAEFRKAYGALVNAQSHLRNGVNGEVERATAQLGMPTRTEVNSSHLKVTRLERELRELKARLAAVEQGAAKPAAEVRAEASAKPAADRAKPAAKPTSKRTAPTARRAK
ncbi:MAG: class III poly(R)-hydroxyalkanoic acid synthase subunit PhaE [Proteobacteria bacterium]|nr:class III poly(R)-hydroxyalkanoic acid synthase subunit PhaE [Pseudomonadota bacterium]